MFIIEIIAAIALLISHLSNLLQNGLKNSWWHHPMYFLRVVIMELILSISSMTNFILDTSSVIGKICLMYPLHSFT